MRLATSHRPDDGGRSTTLPRASVRLLLALTLPAVLLLGGCAYFNTFYHAKKFFAQAEAIERNQAATAVQNAAGGRSTTSQSSRSNDLYRKCIDKCEKVIQKYPGSKWVDDAYLLMGRAYYGKGDYLTAYRELARFPERFPESNLVPEAMFWQGMTALAQDNFESAVEVWTTLLETHPDYDGRESVEYYLAEATERQGFTDEAIAAYEEFLGRYPKGERSVEARLHLGSILLEQDRYEEAEEMFNLVATKAPEEEDRLEGRMRLGQSLEAQDRYQEAYDLYVDLELALDPNVLDGRMSAEERRIQREQQLAAETAAHQDSLLAARMNLHDDPDAERDPAFAGIDDTDQGATGTAAGQTQDQTQDQTQTDQTQTDQTQTGQNQTGIGAVTQTGLNAQNQNQQNQQNQAGKRKLLPSNDPKYQELAKVMLREGITLAELGRPWEAILAFEQVIAEYPRTPYAAEAQYRIGYTQEVNLEDFDLAQQSYSAVASQGRSSFSEDATRRATNLKTVKSLMAASQSDSTGMAAAKEAEARFLRAELFLFQQDKPERALEEYESIERDFAGTDQEAKAALAVAWVRMTALADTARGRAKYVEVMRNFPDTEYGRRATRLLKGPEREPEPTDYAGPSVDELRAAENIAAVALRDSLLAAAEPPEEEAPEATGEEARDPRAIRPRPGGTPPEAGGNPPGVAPGEGGVPGATPPDAGTGEEGGRSSVSDRQRQILERMRRGASPDSMGGSGPQAGSAGEPGAGAPPETRADSTVMDTPGAGVRSLAQTPGGAAGETPGATAAQTPAETAAQTPAETAAETPAAMPQGEGPPGRPVATPGDQGTPAGAGEGGGPGATTPAAVDTFVTVPEALPPPQDTHRLPMPRGPSGKYLDPWAVPKGGWTPVLDDVPTDSTTVVPAEPEPAPAAAPGTETTTEPEASPGPGTTTEPGPAAEPDSTGSGNEKAGDGGDRG